MTWTRYEILLPLFYNDGRRVEAAKFDHTSRQLIEKFSGVTADTTAAFGTWMSAGTPFKDHLQRIRVDVPGIESADDFFVSYKETLKARFEQIDIWITAQEIRVL